MVLYLTRGWRLPTLFPDAPRVEDREGVSRACGPGRRALTTARLPQAPLTPHPLSARPGCWGKRRETSWPAGTSLPVCKDKLKVVRASKFSLQSKELGPKRGQDLLKSLTNQRLSTPLPPATPTTGTKARLEPAPDPWVILGRSSLSPGLGVPGVIDTRTGRAQPLTHPPPRTCQQDVCPGDRHAGGH